MHSTDYWIRMAAEEGIEATAGKMNSICQHGRCPMAIDASSGCPVMELCLKSCAVISEADWTKWLAYKIRQQECLAHM